MRASKQNRYGAESLGVLAVIVGLALFLPPHESQIAALTAIFALAGVGQNILVGYSGVLSLGHVAFLAIGAYGWARLSETGTVLTAFVLPVLVSLLVAAAIVAITLRVSGYYFAVTTLAIGLLAIVVVENWTAVTNGYGGIANIPQLGVPGFAGPDQVLVIVGTVLAVVYFLQCVLKESPLGTAMLAMRFDPAASQALGVSVTGIKFVTFMISSVPVTLAGAFLAQVVGYIGPAQFTMATSIQLIAIAIIGGRGWRWAPLVGALVVITLPELARPLADWRLVFYGAVLTFVALFMPRGLSQIADLVAQKWRGATKDAQVTA